MKRKKIVIPLCILLIVCLAAGGIFAVLQLQASKKIVDVTPVMNISTFDSGNYAYSSGRITSDVSQNVFLDKESTVKDIYVQQGDTVTVGTPLMQYDTTLMELDIETKELDIKAMDMNINQLNKDIQSLKNGVVPETNNNLPILPPGGGDMASRDTHLTASAVTDSSSDTKAGSLNDPVQASVDSTTASNDSSDAPNGSSGAPTNSSNTPTDSSDAPTDSSDADIDSSKASTDSTDTSAGSTDTTDSSDTPSGSTEGSEESTDTSGESPNTPPEPEVKPENLLDGNFDFSKYEDSVDAEGYMSIPCTLTTQITPEFINILRGRNSDGSMKEIPDPNNPEETIVPEPKPLKVKLTFKDYEQPLKFDGKQLPEPYLNSKALCTIQEFIHNDFQLLTDKVTLFDEAFFNTHIKDADDSRSLTVLCDSKAELTREFIYLLMGRDAGGKESNAPRYSLRMELEDLDKAIILDGTTLALPYVTSINTSIARFMELKFELDQKPIDALDKDTELDVSKDHREVYEIYCDENTIITKDFINRIRNEKLTVILKIKGQASWITLDGSIMEAPAENTVDTPLADFIANGIALNEKQPETPDTGGGDIGGGDIGGGDIGGGDIGGGDITGPTYTPDEIKKMLSDKQLELSRLQTQRKQAELDLKKMKQKLVNATVTSSITGVVTTMQVLDETTDHYKPFIVISSTEGLYLTGSINELNLGTLTVGQKVSAMSWNTGATLDATIKEISPYPSSGDYSYGNNPNSSSYPFIARIDNPPEGLTENEYVDIYTGDHNPFTGMNTTGMNLFLYKAYVRDDGDGKPYVYIANDKGRLEKRYVSTGKLLYSQWLEITDGSVTQEDYLAFPYGKDVREGVKTQINEDTNNIY